MRKIFKFPRFSTLSTTSEELFTKAYVIFNSKVKANHSLIAYFQRTPLSSINEHQKSILSLALGISEPKCGKAQLSLTHLPYEIREMDFEILLAELADTLTSLGFSSENVREAIFNVEKMRENVIKRPLCEKMGGEQKLAELMSLFFGRLLNDPELKPFYSNFEPTKLKDSYSRYFLWMFEGSNRYSGKDLRLAHQSFDLTDRHFYLYKKHLSECMMACKYDAKIIEEAVHKLEKQRTAVLNSQTPFEELGGKFGIRQLVEAWFAKSLGDPLLRPIFREVDVDQLKDRLTEFLGKELGNSEKIATKDVKSVHAKYNLSDFHLDAFKFWMQKTLEEQNISDSVIRDMLWVLEKYRRDVCRVNLYDIIGGERTVLRITELLAQKVCKDKQLHKYFQKFKHEELKHILRSMLSYALGGPRAFRGKDIKVCHSGLGISGKEFEQMKKIVEETLKEIGIVDSLIVQLMRVIEMKRNDIVDGS